MKILIVEDDAHIRQGLIDALAREGYDLIAAENGKVGLEKYLAEKPDFVILDVMMPQMDGWELLQLLKLDEQVHHIPIIVCSAWDDPNLSRNLGAAAFLKKPATQKMLLEVVDQFVSPD